MRALTKINGKNFLMREQGKRVLKEVIHETSLVVQWLRIRLAVQGMPVRSLVRELSPYTTARVHVQEIPRDTTYEDPMSQNSQVNIFKKIIHVKNGNAFYKTGNIVDWLANNESVTGLKTALETLEATNLK